MLLFWVRPDMPVATGALPTSDGVAVDGPSVEMLVVAFQSSLRFDDLPVPEVAEEEVALVR